jgi:hypothetical protein
MAILRRAGLAMLGAAGLVLLGAGPAAAQEGFRVTYNVDNSSPTRTVVTGWVFNEARMDAFDVHVTAEALDGTGKTVARGIAFVSRHIPTRGSAPFEAVVPARGAATYRVRVTGFRLGLGPAEAP